MEYFKPLSSNLLYYTSPFEKRLKVASGNQIAFLYLGAFSIDKGAKEILKFIQGNDYKLYIFGDTSQELYQEIDSTPNIFYKNRISSIELYKELEVLFQKYSFIGFSLIHDVHYSYATQEANKDIDYLAMGIPMIANYRKPTKEKIDAGCGVFFDDTSKLQMLLNDEELYQTISNRCIEYYNKNYAQDIFEKKLLEVVKNV